MSTFQNTSQLHTHSTRRIVLLAVAAVIVAVLMAATILAVNNGGGSSHAAATPAPAGMLSTSGELMKDLQQAKIDRALATQVGQQPQQPIERQTPGQRP